MNYDELENPNTGGDEVPKEKTSEDIIQKLPPGSDPNNLNQPANEEVPDVEEKGLDDPKAKEDELRLVPEPPAEKPREPDWSAPIAKEDEHEQTQVVRAETITTENNNTENDTSVSVNEAGENDN